MRINNSLRILVVCGWSYWYVKSGGQSVVVLQIVQMSLVEWAGAPSSGGAGLPDIEQKRVAALCRSKRRDVRGNAIKERAI